MHAERKKFRKSLFRLDLVVFTVAAFVSVDGIAAMAAYGGGQTLFWIAALIVVYLIPYGMIVAEMGSTFPMEGGPYAWVRMAFGRLPAALTAFLYGASNPIWIGGTLAATCVAAIDSLVLPAGHPLGTAASIAVGLAVVWVTVMSSTVEMKYGKLTGWIGTIARLLTLLLFLTFVVVFLFEHGKPAGTVTVSDLRPTLVGFLGVIGLLQFNFIGFELSSGAAEEMTNPKKDVPKMILRSGLIATLVTGALILGVLLVVNGTMLSSVAGFTDAYASVSGVLGGAQTAFNWFVCLLIILVIISAGGVWQQGGVRIGAVAALDGAAPLWFGKFNKQGTPLTMNLFSGALGSVLVISVFLIAHGSVATYFTLVISCVVSLTALGYVFQFPAILMLRKKYPSHHRPYRVPGGSVFLWICVAAVEIITLISVTTFLWPGLLNNLLGQPYSMQDTWGVSRATYEIVSLGVDGFIVFVAVLFWAIGRRNLRRGVVADGDLLAIDPELGSSPQETSGSVDAPAMIATEAAAAIPGDAGSSSAA